MQTKLPPPVTAVRDQICRLSPGERGGQLVPARESRGHALARQQLGDLRPHGGQARVLAGEERGVCGERSDLGQVRPQRVVGPERPRGGAGSNVDLKGEDELAAHHDLAELLRHRAVARGIVDLTGRGRAGMHAGRGQSHPVADRKGEVTPAGGEVPPDLLHRARGCRNRLELAGRELELEPRIPVQHLQDLWRTRRELVGSGIEEHQLLLNPDRSRLGSVERARQLSSVCHAVRSIHD